MQLPNKTMDLSQGCDSNLSLFPSRNDKARFHGGNRALRISAVREPAQMSPVSDMSSFMVARNRGSMRSRATWVPERTT